MYDVWRMDYVRQAIDVFNVVLINLLALLKRKQKAVETLDGK